MSYKVFISIHYDFINDNIRFRNKYNVIGDILYLYYRYSNIEIIDYDDNINNIIIEFYKLKNYDNYVKMKVNKKSIARFKFLKQLYIKIN